MKNQRPSHCEEHQRRGNQLTKLTRSLLPIFIGIAMTVLFPQDILAQEKDFLVEADVTYELNENSEVDIKHEIRLENLYTEKYTNQFEFSLSGIDVNNLSAYDESGELETELVDDNNSQKIIVNFNNNLVGKNKYRNFVIDFTDTSLLTKTGEVWEANIPKLLNPDSFDAYDVRFIVPKQLGDIAYMTPQATSSFDAGDSIIYYFEKQDLADAGVTAALGEFQSFSFDLSYHLENPLIKSTKVEIALPPDTAYQQVFYDQIEPKPNNITITEEGNWMAEYTLAPRERVDVRATGYVKIFAGARYKSVVSEEFLEKNLRPTKFWQSNDPQIIKLAQELKTADNIYNYIINNLVYNYENVTPTTKRLGAKTALNLPDQAICTEFTDLFIALSRAAGIPAREINGFAATDNPSLQPLSLVADVLHAWPEYWDQERNIWVPVDPTWGHTTGGADYFSKLDLKHFTFVIHGLSDVNPPPPGSYKLGSNPQKDVYVSFSEIPEDIEGNDLAIDISKKSGNFFGGQKIIAEISNNNPNAIYNQHIKIYFDNQLESEELIEVLVPYGKQKIEFIVPYGILGNNMPETAKIEVGEFIQEIATDKQNKVLKDIILISAIFIIIIILGIIYVKK